MNTRTDLETAPAPRRRFTRALGGGGLAVAIATVAVFAIAGPASAHVKVSGTDATRGGYGVVTFRVPSESATASTTELTVTLPSDTPILSADTQPKAGWTATVTTAKLAKPLKTDDGETTEYVSKVDWKANTPADAIPAGEFDMFNLSVGPLPDQASVAFPALQYYSDGTTVNWNEKSADGKTEPEHPAPVLELAAAPGAATSSDAPSVTTTASGTTSGPDGFGIAGLVAGILGLIAGVIALVRSRRKTTATA
jgi:uncharacterized protein YcnI